LYHRKGICGLLQMLLGELQTIRLRHLAVVFWELLVMEHCLRWADCKFRYLFLTFLALWLASIIFYILINYSCVVLVLGL
jgi:hypothetical protein